MENTMQIDIEQHGEHCIIHLMGDFVLAHVTELKDTLLDTLNDCQQLDVDLVDVSDIDTAGIQLLLLLKREALTSKKNCHLIHHSRVVVDMLETYQLSHYFGDPLVLSSW